MCEDTEKGAKVKLQFFLLHNRLKINRKARDETQVSTTRGRSHSIILQSRQDKRLPDKQQRLELLDKRFVVIVHKRIFFLFWLCQFYLL